MPGVWNLHDKERLLRAALFIGVPSMFDSLGVQVLFTTRWR
jgi:hypothetical protein